MKKYILIGCLLHLLTCTCKGQEPDNYSSRWQTRPSLGYNLSESLFKGLETDHLLQFNHNANYWQLISATYFFNRRWGIDFCYQGMSSPNISGRGERFMDLVKEQHQANYYVTAGTGAIYNEVHLISGSFERGMLGVIYRFEQDRFLFYPKLSMGVTSFYTDWGHAYLKEQNTNKVHYLNYSPGSNPNDFFTLSAAAIAGVKINSMLYFHVELGTHWYRASVDFTKTLTDLFTLEQTNESISYRKNMFNLSLGTGVIIAL